MSTARALATPTWRTSTGGGARRRRLRRDDGERRSSARAFQGADIPDDLLEAAKNGMGTFMERASRAVPIMLGRDGESVMTTGGDVEVAVKTRTEAKAVELNRARVESLLKPDAGRDDIFHAAGQGLTEIGGDVVPVGWWDVHGKADASPELELQALNNAARAQLVGAVLLALKEALENIEESEGSLRTLIQKVARISANDWMDSMGLSAGAEERCAKVMSLAGDVADERIWKTGQVLEGSKTALYAGVLMYLAQNSQCTERDSESVEVVQTETEISMLDVEPVLEFFNSPMASVCVSVLQDVVLNIADSVASAYVTCARDSAAKAPVNGGVSQENNSGAVVRVSPFRDALNVRLKNTRALEKFRNETSLRSWLTRNYYDVIAMYEDWHMLLGMNEIGELVTRKIHVCRQPELEKVKGFRLAVSMVVELADVTLPLFKSALNNFSRVASWLLVTLIGRSLGLIYRGIKESMDPQNRVKFS